MDYTKDVTIKKLIAKRIKENDINVVILCRNAGVRYKTFVLWMNAKKHYSLGHDHFEEKLVKNICKQLGIKVRVRYIVEKRDYDSFLYLRSGRVNRRKDRIKEEIQYLRDEVAKLDTYDEA